MTLFLVRPGANRLRTRIVSSISFALGRPVDVASVRLRFLPQPGFDLKNLVIHDDPAFGAEPMLRAQEVTASLRLTSLARGRLEISRLDFSEPSLNLVRSAQGHWNFENLVERAQKIPVAPTAKAKSEKRPGFPYIDCSRGRINVKIGPEKKPYALTQADFSLWQESENAWGMRLKGRPVRIDFNLTDTGILQVSGSWQRAGTLRETPLQFTLEWEGAQLGQLSKLAYGNDKGWRGTIGVSATLVGTAANLILSADASAEDFRRYDVLAADRLRLSTRCNARYSSVGNTLSDIACRAPVGKGMLAVTGQVENASSAPAYDLVLTAQAVPLQSLLAFARHVHRTVPDDLVAEGRLDAAFRGNLLDGMSGRLWEGSGQTSGFRLKSTLADAEIVLGAVPFAISTEHAKFAGRVPSGRAGLLTSEPHVEIGPFRASLAKPAPVVVQGRVGREGYDFSLRGEAQLMRLLQAARVIGIPAPELSAEGSAKMDLRLVGKWSELEPPRVVGKAQLRSIRAQIHGLNGPVEIGSANLTLTQDEISVQNVVALAAGTSWRGSLLLARPCAMTATCPVRFDLHADEIHMDRLNQLFNPEARREPWYRALSSSVASGTPLFMRVNASGSLRADKIVLSKLEARHVTTIAELKSGKLRLSDLQGDFLGGHHNAQWNANFMVTPPEYSGSGVFYGIALGQLAEAMNQDWITGTATASYHASALGLSSKELFASATANLQVNVTAGVLPHLILPTSATPLQMRHLAAHLWLHDQRLDFRTGQLETGTDVFHLSGTASLTQDLDLKLIREDTSGFSIAGTLTEPHVSQIAASETRAALKP
jgi:AsmA family